MMTYVNMESYAQYNVPELSSSSDDVGLFPEFVNQGAWCGHLIEAGSASITASY
jgi:hypothetical protein